MCIHDGEQYIGKQFIHNWNEFNSITTTDTDALGIIAETKYTQYY